MREILFRGKRVDNGEWVEGLLWKKKYNHSKLFISCFPDKDDNEEVFVICPETVGQYTGLTDKNGKKIFEGDIVKFMHNDKEHKLPIEYRMGQFFVGINYPIAYVRFSCEVIGNIHDNPELLNGGNENV